jgi:hypothetical protein
MDRTRGVVIASAVATLILTGAVRTRADTEKQHQPGDKVMCEGINECAGKSTCSGSKDGCAGMNSCKGKGVVDSTFKECVCQGGKVVDEKDSSAR